MTDFFSNQPGQPLEWFGPTHILLTLGFLATVVLLWIFAPKLRGRKLEPWVRFAIIALVVLFEWRVFESRMLQSSLFRMPLCAVALYTLTFSVAFQNKTIFKIGYFFAFGSLLSFLFYDTPFGLDRWSGWTFFGAHATIAWLAVYGYRALGFTPTFKDLQKAFLFLLGYGIVSGYATWRFGGVDEMFLWNPPVDFLMGLRETSWFLYILPWAAFAVACMFLMYLSVSLTERKRKHKNG